MLYRSEDIDQLLQMIIAANEEILAIEPDKEGNRGVYIGRDHMLKSSNNILKQYDGRVIVLDRYDAVGGLMLRVEVHHVPSKQWIASEYTIDEHQDYSTGDVNHKKGGSTTYGIRYILGPMLGMAIGDDDYEPQDATKGEHGIKRLWAELFKIEDKEARKSLMQVISNTCGGARINDFDADQCRVAMDVINKYKSR